MPIVDLAHLTRRPDLERSVDFSPVAIGIYLLMFAGFGLAGWSVVGGFTPWLFTAGAVLLVLSAIVAGLYMQFVKFDCPSAVAACRLGWRTWNRRTLIPWYPGA